jgi:CubicO group peptidase (beta-lactamase class C family)
MYSFTSLPDSMANERLDLTHEQVLGLIKDKPFDFEPGTSWRYNNTGFYIAGMVVERVIKQEYGAYLLEHVFKPLGMNTAQLCDARTVVPHLASGYELDHGTFVHAAFMSWKLPFAAGAVCATATDLLKWQAALDAGRLLSAASLNLMRTPTALADGTVIDYGVGTRLGMLHGHRVLGHTGSGGGFAAALESFPNDRLTVAVLVNAEVGGTAALNLAAAIARTMLSTPENGALRDLPVPNEELSALPGVFDSDEGTVEIFAHDGKLRYRKSGQEGGLLRQAENVYAVNENVDVHFLVRGGRAEWAVVYIGGLLMDPVRRVR